MSNYHIRYYQIHYIDGGVDVVDPETFDDMDAAKAHAERTITDEVRGGSYDCDTAPDRCRPSVKGGSFPYVIDEITDGSIKSHWMVLHLEGT